MFNLVYQTLVDLLPFLMIAQWSHGYHHGRFADIAQHVLTMVVVHSFETDDLLGIDMLIPDIITIHNHYHFFVTILHDLNSPTGSWENLAINGSSDGRIPLLSLTWLLSIIGKPDEQGTVMIVMVVNFWWDKGVHRWDNFPRQNVPSFPSPNPMVGQVYRQAIDGTRGVPLVPPMVSRYSHHASHAKFMAASPLAVVVESCSLEPLSSDAGVFVSLWSCVIPDPAVPFYFNEYMISHVWNTITSDVFLRVANRH